MQNNIVKIYSIIFIFLFVISFFLLFYRYVYIQNFFVFTKEDTVPSAEEVTTFKNRDVYKREGVYLWRQ